MKKLLLIGSFLLSAFSFSQVNIIPMNNHYYNPYNVTLNASGTIYYTTDGTAPNLSSASAVNTVQININQNKVIKAFSVNSSGTTSAVVTKKYYVGTLPVAQIFFKPPTGWTNGACILPNMVNPNSVNGGVVDYFWPGPQMQNTGCNGWYKSTAAYEEGSLIFNNCALYPNLPGSVSTGSILAGSVIYYDFSNGAITNPPSCLILSTGENAANNVVQVKIYSNPVGEVLSVKTEILFKTYQIVDASGKAIESGEYKSDDFVVSHLAPGNYYLKLTDLKNNLTVLKFIKK